MIFNRIVTSSTALIVLMGAQAFCAAFFVVDLIHDFRDHVPVSVSYFHISLEALANLGLVSCILIEAALLRRLLRRQAYADRAVSAASSALYEVMEARFTEWGLTPSEADVATFLIKGCSIAEIARLRRSAEGTVKTHLNAIYRKAGVTGRAQLVSLLIDEIMGRPLLDEAAPAGGAEIASLAERRVGT